MFLFFIVFARFLLGLCILLSVCHRLLRIHVLCFLLSLCFCSVSLLHRILVFPCWLLFFTRSSKLLSSTTSLRCFDVFVFTSMSSYFESMFSTSEASLDLNVVTVRNTSPRDASIRAMYENFYDSYWYWFVKYFDNIRFCYLYYLILYECIFSFFKS